MTGGADMWIRRTTIWCVGLPGATVQFVLMPEQPSLRSVHRRPPGFPVSASVAPDPDVTAAVHPVLPGSHMAPRSS